MVHIYRHLLEAGNRSCGKEILQIFEQVAIDAFLLGMRMGEQLNLQLYRSYRT